jgi:hypothetical protein
MIAAAYPREWVILLNPPSFTRKGKRVRLAPPQENVIILPLEYSYAKVKIRTPV